MIIDLHSDMFSHITENQQKKINNTFEKYHLENFKKGDVVFSFFNMWINGKENAEEKFKEMLRCSSEEMNNNKNMLNKITSKNQINQINDQKINYLISLEGLDYVKNYKDIYWLYDYGVRSIILTWNYTNSLCGAQKENPKKGLTKEGVKVIQLMEQLGIIIDISHVSDAGVDDIFKVTEGVIIASHSNVRNICKNPRNLTDEQIKKIAMRGGVIGVTAYPDFISNNKKEHTVEKLVEHIEYIVNLIGEDYVAVGFDFIDYLTTGSSIDEIVYLNNLRNHSQINNLTKALENRGFSKKTIEKIYYANIIRVLNEVLK